MDAVQAATGSGGWPWMFFLHPIQNLLGGTYFPPLRAYNRSSLDRSDKPLLPERAAKWNFRRQKTYSGILSQSGQLEQVHGLPWFSKQQALLLQPIFWNRQTPAGVVLERHLSFPANFLYNTFFNTITTQRCNCTFTGFVVARQNDVWWYLWSGGGGFARYRQTENGWCLMGKKMLYDNAHF